MTAQRFDYLATGCWPSDPFRFAGRSFTGSAVLGLRRTYGEFRLRNACIALDALPYDENLRAIAQWCYEDDNAAIY